MDGLSLETLELIQSTAVEAAGAEGKVKVIPAPELGDGKALIVNPVGHYDIRDRESPRSHRFGTLESVADWVTYAKDALGQTPVVWVAADQIRIVPDDKVTKSAKDNLSYTLTPTPEYLLIQKLAKGEVLFDQKPFVRMLRTELWDCLDPVKRDAWIKMFRSLRSKTDIAGHSSTGTGRESLGMDILAQTSSDHGDLPDEIPLWVRLFQDPTLAARQQITTDLELTANTFKFSLSPRLPDLAEALENELSDIVKWLKSKLPATDIFRGTP